MPRCPDPNRPSVPCDKRASMRLWSVHSRWEGRCRMAETASRRWSALARSRPGFPQRRVGRRESALLLDVHAHERIRRRPMTLLGRRAECAALDRLLADVLAGRTRVAVLRGEAGV